MRQYTFARIATIFASSLLLMSAAGCGDSGDGGNASGSSDKPVAVAVYNNSAPAAYVENGQLVGWVVELLDELETKTGLRFDIKQVDNFSTIIPGLQSGRFDIAGANITVSPERMQIVDFVTVDTTGTAFATPSNGGAAITQASDACGLRLAVLSGSVYEQQLKEINAECASAGKQPTNAALFPDNSSAALAVKNGRADGYMGGSSAAAYLAQQVDGLSLQKYQFAMMSEGIGFPKDSPHTQKFVKAMNELIADGTYAKILEKAGLSNIAASESVIMPGNK